MANSKISALTAATTPLAGTETLPVVQSGATKQVSVANLTAGRAVSASSLSLTTPLTVANGGTGTGTALGSGSVVFTDSSGIFSSNNGSFFWDNSTQRLNIGGNTAPARRLELTGLTGGPPLRITNTNGNTGVEMLTGSTKYSWLLAAQYNVDQTFEITASTATGGTTFSTPLFTVEAPSGDVGIKAGNVVQGTAAKGYNFSANSTLAGKTSTLLNWYEEGTWTVTWTNLTGTPSNTTGYYTRIGRQVFFTYAAGANSISGTANSTRFSLPYAPAVAAAGTMINDAVASAGTLLIWTSQVAYPTTFNSGSMIFSGVYHV